MFQGKTVGFIGAGNICEAIIKGLIASGKVTPAQIIASDKCGKRLAHIAENYDIKVFNKNFEAARAADIILLTVKPNDSGEVFEEIGSEIERGKLLISSMAGIATDSIKQALTHPLPVMRVMPNTPALLQEGAIGLYADPDASPVERELTLSLFESVGTVVVVDDEGLLDAVTGLSGSGPAYFFLLLEAFIDAGVSVGLPREQARTLSLQTALGSIRLAMESPKELSELREMVTSPGGTTVAGLAALEEHDVRVAIIKAVQAATKRAGELTK
ncbi:MAG: pyrroline-5-carboxylate reductase [Thermodesulfobacteriota bacterium]